MKAEAPVHIFRSVFRLRHRLMGEIGIIVATWNLRRKFVADLIFKEILYIRFLEFLVAFFKGACEIENFAHQDVICALM